MGQITSGIGLISGIDINSLVEQLVAIEARPKTFVQNRNTVLNSQQVAFQDINANLLALKTAADNLAKADTFKVKAASSSNESVLTATAGTTATPGTYDFIVDRLLQTQQLITQGFEDKDATAVGAGTLSFEFGEGRLDTDTRLSQLNGSNGVSRGKIRITDRSGASAVIDLSKALTVKDVLTEINNASGIDVTARAEGDGLIIDDNTGLAAGNLTIGNLGTTNTATSLGIAGSVAADTLTGAAINSISASTRLTALNDANGVRYKTLQNDFSITQKDGTSFNVNLSAVSDVGDVIDAINAASVAAGGSVTASLNDDKTGIKLVDASAGGGALVVASLNGSHAAVDLGILGSATSGTIDGDRVIANLNSKLLKNMLGGTGFNQVTSLGDRVLRTTTPLSDLFDGAGLNTSHSSAQDIRIMAKDTHFTNYQIDLDALNTVGDLINAFDTATGGRVTLAIEDNKLRVTDNTGGPQNLRIDDLGSTSAMAELGLQMNDPVVTRLGNDTTPTRDVLSASGPGQFEITNSVGATTEVDLSGLSSVDEVLRAINHAGAGVTASLNAAGNGIMLTDTAGGVGDLIIADTNGSFATSLGLAGTHSGRVANSGNAQLQYITEATRLDSLHGGKGVTRGKFTITDSTGESATVDLTQGNEVTIGDVIDEINSRGLAINARVNDQGDGILIEDTGIGAVAIKITESGGTIARNLGLLGEAANPGDDLDGSFEKTIEIDAADTLQDVTDKINDAGIGVRATIINDGSGVNPYRLNILAADAGKAGAFVFDGGGIDFKATTLVEARNGVVFFGSQDAANAIAIDTASTTLSSLIPGATLTLESTSDAPVRVTIDDDYTAITSAATEFVTKFNKVMTTLDKYDNYDAETEQRGLLLGDSTIQRIRSSLFNRVIGRDGDLSGQFSSLSQIGIRVGSGAKLNLDSEKLSAALEADFESVRDLFTFKQTETDDDTGKISITAAGIGVDIAELLKGLTDATDGALARRLGTIDNQVDLNKKRIERIDIQLEAKRQRLLSQFFAMESTLAQLQGQSTALAGFQPISFNNQSKS
jgi:flagellar hook-associated protein 2